MAKDRVQTEFVVFPAGPTDAMWLAQVHVICWRETYAGLLPAPYLARMSTDAHAARFAQSLDRPREGEVTLAAATKDWIVGYAHGGPSRRKRPGEAEIETLYVMSRLHGLGMGRALLTSAARVLADNGATSLVISVLRDNAPARGFYEHLGGVAEEPRLEPSPGGGRIHEVLYRWDDIGVLLG